MYSITQYPSGLIFHHESKSRQTVGIKIDTRALIKGNGQKRELPVVYWPETDGQNYEGSKHSNWAHVIGQHHLPPVFGQTTQPTHVKVNRNKSNHQKHTYLVYQIRTRPRLPHPQSYSTAVVVRTLLYAVLVRNGQLSSGNSARQAINNSEILSAAAFTTPSNEHKV